MENLRVLSLDDRPFFESLCAANPSESCERCFGVNFMWRGSVGYPFAKWRGRAVFFDSRAGFALYPIGGDTPPVELSEMLCELSARSLNAKFVYDVPPDYPEKFPEVAEFFKIEANPDDFDYIYDAQNLFEMRGAVLRKKRNHIKHFKSLNPNWRQEEFNGANIAQAREFMMQLAMPNEVEPLARAFDFFDKLPLDGILLRGENGKIAAAAIMGALSPQMYSVHFEKSDKTLEGAAQMIVFLEALRLIGRGVKFMNREQDLGLENLRHAKRSLDPLRFYRRLKLYPIFK